MAGYSGSLFDPKGPNRFATSLIGVTDAMGDVVGSVVQMGEKFTESLTSISEQYDDLISKAGTLNVTRGEGAVPGGAPSSPGGPGDWTPRRPNAGKTGGAQEESPRPFGPGTTGGAAMAIGSAAVGGLRRFAAANQSTVMQAGITGQQYSNWFGGGRGDYMTVPIIQGGAGMGGRGTEAYTVGGQSDYVESQSILMQMGVRPMSTNKAIPPTPTQSMFQTTLNTAMLMNQGMTRAQGAAAFSSMYTGAASQKFASVGINVRPSGQNTDPYVMFEDIFQKTYPSQSIQAKLNQDDILNALTPGGPLESNFEYFGLDPNGDLFSLFTEYVLGRQDWVQQNPGKPIPTGSSMQKAFKLDQGPYAASLKKSSRATQAKSLVTPSQATVDEHLDNAAEKLTRVAEQLFGTNTKGGKQQIGALGTGLGTVGKLGGLALAGAALAAGAGLGPGGGPTAGVNNIDLSKPGSNIASPAAGSKISGLGNQLMSLSTSTPTAPATLSPVGLGGLESAASGVTPSGGYDWYGTLAGPTGGAVPTPVNFPDTLLGLVGKSGSGSTGSGTPAMPASGTGSTTDLGTGSNISKGYNYFVIKGLADYQSAGIIGNLMEESGMDPTSVQKGGPGRGIAQWSVNERWTGVLDLARTQSKSPTDLHVQLDYLWQELNSTEKSSLTALQATKNVDDATASFEKNYERAGVPAMSVRQGNAEKVLDQAHKGTLARGSYNVDRTQLALLHKGERVVPAADNFSVVNRYRRLNSGSTGDVQVHKNIPSGAIVLAVPANPTSSDMDNLAQQFSVALTQVSTRQASRAS